MKTFKQVANENKGFFIDKDGYAVPEHPIHFKHRGKKTKKHKKKHKNLKEEFAESTAKPKVAPLHDLPGQHPLPPYPRKDDPNFEAALKAHKDAFKKDVEAHKKTSEELHSHQRKLDDKEKQHAFDYSEGEEGGTHSFEIARRLIDNHKKGKPPTHGMELMHADMHHTIANLAKQKLGQDVHLYSGVGFNPKVAANKSKDKILHLPAHISTTHDARTANMFADLAAENTGSASRHMIHIDAKAHDKGFHLGNYSQTETEHETVIPAGTKLKYSHSTVHKNDDGDKVNVHHFTIHSQD